MYVAVYKRVYWKGGAVIAWYIESCDKCIDFTLLCEKSQDFIA